MPHQHSMCQIVPKIQIKCKFNRKQVLEMHETHAGRNVNCLSLLVALYDVQEQPGLSPKLTKGYNKQGCVQWSYSNPVKRMCIWSKTVSACKWKTKVVLWQIQYHCFYSLGSNDGGHHFSSLSICLLPFHLSFNLNYPRHTLLYATYMSVPSRKHIQDLKMVDLELVTPEYPNQESDVLQTNPFLFNQKKTWKQEYTCMNQHTLIQTGKTILVII